MSRLPSPATSQVQACAFCGDTVGVRDRGAHTQTHVDPDTGAAVRLAWHAKCVDRDPLLVALAEADALPEGDIGGAAEVWAVHEQIHARVVRLATENPFAPMVGTMKAPNRPPESASAALRASFFVSRDSRDRRFTFRGTGRAWGIRARVA